jgi:amidohydrolase
MLEEGIFELCPVDAVFGLHNWPGLKVGQFAVSSGPAFASVNEFKILIRGKSAHAAMPHNAVDPIPIASQMMQAFHTIVARNMRPIDPAVISVTMIHAGEAFNVVPDTCEMHGTVRAFAPEVLDMIEKRMRQIAQGTCAAFGATCEFEFRRICAPTVNHAKEAAFVRDVLQDFVGGANVLDFEPTMAGEDFGCFLLNKPGCYFVIGNGESDHRLPGHGSGPCMLHNASYDFNDALVPLGGAMWVRLVERWFTTPM